MYDLDRSGHDNRMSQTWNRIIKHVFPQCRADHTGEKRGNGARGPGELAGFKQSGIPNFSFLNVVDDYKIFVVARDDAKTILKNKDKSEFKYIIDYCKRSIDEEDIIKA